MTAAIPQPPKPETFGAMGHPFSPGNNTDYCVACGYDYLLHGIRKPEIPAIEVDRIAINDALSPIWAEYGLGGEEHDEALNELAHEVASRIEAEAAK